MARSLRPALAGVTLGLLLGMTGAAHAKDEKPKPNAREDEARFINKRYPPEFCERVNGAIDRGVKWLISKQEKDGSWQSRYNKNYPMGPTALATLTLLKGGVKPGHASLRKAFGYLRKLPLKKTYSVAILLMALDARYAPARDPFIVEKLDRYGRSVRKDPCLEHITKRDLNWMRRGVSFLIRNQTSDGVWRYPSQQDYDLSNTQYALLGLKAAVRCGIKIPARVWLDALKYLVAYQEAKGPPVEYQANEVRGRYRIQWKEKAQARGFRYRKPKAPVSGSMTTAGLAGLIICQSELWSSRKFRGKLRSQTRAGIRDAMAWLQLYMEVRVNPLIGDDGKALHEPAPSIGGLNHYYYLYGLERASILGRIRFYGKRDWYREGADQLLFDQRTDGHWPDQKPLVQTCFAILFLKRATTRISEPVITPGPGKPPADTRSKPKKKDG